MCRRKINSKLSTSHEHSLYFMLTISPHFVFPSLAWWCEVKVRYVYCCYNDLKRNEIIKQIHYFCNSVLPKGFFVFLKVNTLLSNSYDTQSTGHSVRFEFYLITQQWEDSGGADRAPYSLIEYDWRITLRSTQISLVVKLAVLNGVVVQRHAVTVQHFSRRRQLCNPTRLKSGTQLCIKSLTSWLSVRRSTVVICCTTSVSWRR